MRLVPVSSGGGSVDPPQRGFDYRSASPGVSATGSDSSSSAALAGGPADSGVAGSKDDVEEGEALDQSAHRWKRVCLVQYNEFSWLFQFLIQYN